MEQTVGAVPKNVKTTVLNVSMDAWNETPYYIAGSDPEKSEHALPFPEGGKLAGRLQMVVPTKDGKTHYACLEDFSGNKFRVRAGKILQENLQPLVKGTGVIITFLGEKESQSSGNTYKNFQIEVIEGGIN